MQGSQAINAITREPRAKALNLIRQPDPAELARSTTFTEEMSLKRALRVRVQARGEAASTTACLQDSRRAGDVLPAMKYVSNTAL